VILLVRHAMPAYEETVSPADWPLSAEGLHAALALDLPANALLVASDEVKAWQTLSHAGPVLRDPRFGEIARPGEPWDGPYRTMRRSYVDGTVPPGWESHVDVAERFDEGVAEFLVRAGDRPLVIGTHGMALTVWLRSRGLLDDPGTFWEALRFPHKIAVDLPSGTLTW